MAIEDLYNSKQEEMDPDDMEDGEYMKRGDLAASLVMCGGKICLCVIEVTGFKFGTEKITQTTAALNDLEDKNKQIKVTGQVIELKPSSPKIDFWEWTRDYLSTDAKDDKLTRQQFVVEIPSFFIHPLVPSVVHKPPPGSLADNSRYPTWRLSSKDLQTVLDFLWDSLEPQTDRIIGNTHMLLSIKNPNALPYQHLDGTKEFFMKDLPNHLIPKEKYSANDKISCHFCREKVKLSQMRNHVGRHILCGLHGIEDKKIEKFLEWKNKQQTPTEDDPEQLGENPCGFCG